MIIEINKDIDRYKETVIMGLTARQLIFSVLSVAVGGGIVLFFYPLIGMTPSVYLAIPAVAPIAPGGFYSFKENGFDFDIREAEKVGADFRNDLCNGMLQFFPDYFRDENKFCRALFIKKYPSSLSDRFLNEIVSLPVHSITSIDIVRFRKK